MVTTYDKHEEHSVACGGGTQKPEGTNNSSGRTHRYEKTPDHREEEVKVLARESNTWWRKIREIVEIRALKPEMNWDNGYDLPAIYMHMYNILQRHPQGVGGMCVLKA